MPGPARPRPACPWLEASAVRPRGHPWKCPSPTLVGSLLEATSLLFFSSFFPSLGNVGFVLFCFIVVEGRQNFPPTFLGSLVGPENSVNIPQINGRKADRFHFCMYPAAFAGERSPQNLGLSAHTRGCPERSHCGEGSRTLSQQSWFVQTSLSSLGLNILSLVIRMFFSSWHREAVFHVGVLSPLFRRKRGGQHAFPASVVFQVSVSQETRSEPPPR